MAFIPTRGRQLALEGQIKREDLTLAEPWEAVGVPGKIAGDLAIHLQK